MAAKVDGNDQKLVQGISNSIKNFVAPDPPEGSPLTHCFVLRSGFTINPADYGTTGDGPKNLAALFNDAPKVSSAWETSGSQISTLWDILLKTGKAPVIPPPAELEKEYQEALRKLYVDPDKRTTKTPFYESLDKVRTQVREKQRELFKFQMELWTMLRPGATQAEYDRAYQQMAPTYIADVQSAQKELLLRQREIDRYQTLVFAYNTGSLETILADFASKMDDYRRGAAAGGTETYYHVDATPSNWYECFKPDYSPDDGWTQVIIDQQYSSTTGNDSYTQMGGKVSYVFFSFKSSGSKEKKTTSKDEKGLRISFKMKVVDIIRPWMDTALLDYKAITMASAEAGQWSTGELKPGNDGSFPLLPTAMVLASDITVSATEFSSKTKEVFEEYSASVGARWNLFCFQGGGSHSSRSSTATWNKDEQTMKVGGVQIIGYVCALNPYFPKKSSE